MTDNEEDQVEGASPDQEIDGDQEAEEMVSAAAEVPPAEDAGEPQPPVASTESLGTDAMSPESDSDAHEDHPEEVEPMEDYSPAPERPRARTGLIAFFVVLVAAIVLIALFQFNKGLSLSSGLAAFFSGLQSSTSGLKVEEMKTGSGPAVQTGDAVTVHYTGYLEDGTQFDSSVTRGEPFTFIVGHGYVIPGWDEGVMGMQEGGVRRLTIPPELAYGEAGAGDVIPPNATLLFDVELLGIHPADYEVLVEGEGPGVEPGDSITLDYTVWLMDGTEIDSSRTAGQPIVFTVGIGQMLPGIEQGVIGMKAGEKRLVTIPPELAFGEQGLGDLIPPGATLQFELELVDIQ